MTVSVTDEVVEASLMAEAQVTMPAGPVDGQPRRREVDPNLWLDHVRYARNRDRAALERLVVEYRTYACSLARRLQRHSEQREDLEQVAMEALLVALRRFDVGRSLPFVAFATPTILGCLRRHYRDRGWLIRVPRSTHELTVAAREASQELTARLGREPSADEVAEMLDVTVDTLLTARSDVLARGVVPLDTTSSDSVAGERQVGRVDPAFDGADNHLALARAMAVLSGADRDLIRRYYFVDYSQQQIAGQLGVSQMEISRRLARLVARLRRLMYPV